MATYQDLFVLRTEGSLIGRAVIAVERAAAQVINEDPLTPNHATRIAWAIKVIGPNAMSQMYATIVLRWAVAENQTLQDQGTAIDDASVQFIVNSYLPRVVAAGV